MKLTQFGDSSIKYVGEKLEMAKREIKFHAPTIIKCVKISTALVISGVALVALARIANHLPIVDMTEAFALGYIIRHPKQCSPITIGIAVAGLIAIQTLTPICSLSPISKLVLNTTAILIAKRDVVIG